MEEEWKNGKFTHEMMQELETKQQRSVHGIREGQLTTQHRTELGNQVSFLLQKPFQTMQKRMIIILNHALSLFVNLGQLDLAR